MPAEDDTNGSGIEQTKQETCYLCSSTDIVGTCISCGKKFCAKDISKIDQRYCFECMNDFVIEEKKYTRTTQEYDADTDTLHTETRSCKQIEFKGIDWMFACKRLSDMSDDEAKIELEYHRAFVHLLESDLVARGVKKYKLKVQSDLDAMHEKRAARIQNIVETRQRKTVKPAKEIDITKFAEMLLKMGITNLNVNGK